MADAPISGEVIDEQKGDPQPVEDAKVMAVPHDSSLAVVRTSTDSTGTFQFTEDVLHPEENKYHIVCRAGSVNFPIRGGGGYTHISAVGLATWESFTPTPPHSYSMGGGYLESSIQAINYSNNDALVHDQDGYNDGTSWKYTSRDYDLSSYSTIKFSTEFTADGRYDQFKVRIGTDTIFECDSNTIGGHSWTDRSFDISGYDGTHELQIGHDVSGGRYRATNSKITNLSFE